VTIPAPAGLPAACATRGVLCDKSAAGDATILTFTGTGLSFDGVPLVQSPSNDTLLPSAPARRLLG
jgi:hypothetical protein